MPIHRPLGLAVAALFSLPATALDYSATYFFGDSLSDSGYFKPTLTQIGQGAAVQAGLVGKFTTNPDPVWADLLAAAQGTSATPSNAGGTNYAIGGARTGTDTTASFGPVTVPVLSTANQVASYLAAQGGRADGNALYSVWSGANDVFYLANPANGIPASSAPALLAVYASQQVAAIQALKNAGARYILVPNLPDMGTTPLAIAQGATAQGGLTALATNYNAFLFGQLVAADLKVIPLDIFNLLREVQANPSAYGFTNTTSTACLPAVTANSLLCGAPGTIVANPQEYVFADGVHPGGRAHAIVADYAEAMLVAPMQIGMLAETAVRTRNTLTDTLIAAGAAAAERSDPVAWAVATGGNLAYGESADVAGADGTPYGLTVGVDLPTRLGRIGFALNMSDYSPDFPNDGGTYSQNEVSVSLYAAHRFGAWGVAASGTIGKIDYDTTRRVKLGSAVRSVEGSTEGSNASLALHVDYRLGSGGLTHGPYATFIAQRVALAGFTESADAGRSTALSFSKHTRAAAIGRIGYQAVASMGNLSPYGRIGYEHEFTDTDRTIEVGLPSAYAGSFEAPAARITEGGVNAAAGLGVKLGAGIDAFIEAAGTFGRDDIDDWGLKAGLRYGF